MDDDLADAAAGKDIGIPRILIERARDVGRRAGVIDAIDADAKETVGRMAPMARLKALSINAVQLVPPSVER